MRGNAQTFFAVACGLIIALFSMPYAAAEMLRT